MSMEKTDALPNDESKRKSKNKSVMSEKQSEVAVVQDPTSAKLDPEKSDRHDITGDRENVHGADRVESENLKDKEGIPNPEVNKMQLKYSYREDIWGPVNPESKKQYDRDFLLQFQKECTHKPDGLPNIPDLVLSKMSVVQPLYRKSNRRGKQKSSDLMKSPRVQENIGYKRGPDNKGDKSDKTKSFSNEDAKKIQAQFALKGAMVASDIPQPTDLSQSHRVPPAPQQPQSKQPNYPTGQANRSSQEPLKMTHRPFHPQSYPQVYSPTTSPYNSSPPQQVWMNAAAQSSPRKPFTSQPTATRPDGQRRKNIIRVVDPTTNQDVTEMVMRDTLGSSSPHPHHSSANVTPKSFSNENAKKIQAQFTSKVAMVASDIPQPTDLSQSHRVPPAPQQSQSKQPNYPTGQAKRSSQEPLKMTQAYSPTTPSYYSSPPQQVWMNAAAQSTPRKPFTSQPAATRPDGQRRKNIIRVVDPTTNQDVTEMVMRDTLGSSSPHPHHSSANVTPKGVEVTLDANASAAAKGLNSVSPQVDWLHVFKRGLTSLLNERPDNSQIFDWIEGNISHTQKQHSEFIRALVTIICQNTGRGEGQSCRINAEILKLHCPVLQRYIDNKFLLELQALYAVQALNHSLHSPPGLIRILFDVLYDEDVVTEEAFYNWKISDDPKESNGKGVALKSVRSFFTWLAEPEAEAN